MHTEVLLFEEMSVSGSICAHTVDFITDIKTEHLSTLSSASKCDKVPLRVVRLFCKCDSWHLAVASLLRVLN